MTFGNRWWLIRTQGTTRIQMWTSISNITPISCWLAPPFHNPHFWDFDFHMPAPFYQNILSPFFLFILLPSWHTYKFNSHPISGYFSHYDMEADGKLHSSFNHTRISSYQHGVEWYDKKAYPASINRRLRGAAHSN